jgi:predicted nucleic acid-binding Zn finger protein
VRDLEFIRIDLNTKDMMRLYGARFTRAWEIVKGEGVTMYVFNPSGRRIWGVRGRSREYQVLRAAAYCGCADFYYNVIDGDANACCHLIAQRLAEALLRFRVVRLLDHNYNEIVHRLRNYSRACPEVNSRGDPR